MIVRLSFSFPIGENIILENFSGFVARGLFYSILSIIDEDLAKSVHDAQTIAPYSCSPIYTIDGGKIKLLSTAITVGRSRFDAILLDEKLIKTLTDVRNLRRINGAKIKVHSHTTVIDKIDVEVIHEKTLYTENAYRKLKVTFLTPTFFRKPCPYIPQRYIEAGKIKLQRKPNSIIYLYPDPQLLFNNITRIWEKFLTEKPGSFEKFKTWIDYGGLAISEHKLKTVKITEHKSTDKYQRGFIGWIKLTATDNNPEMLRIAYILLKFAEVVGVGGCRTAGFGRIRVEVL